MAAGLAGGCDTTRIEGQVDWRSDDGTIAAEYMAPPWEVDREVEDELHLRIAAEVFGTALDGSPPTHVFGLGRVDPSVSLSAWLPTELVDPAAGAADAALPDAATGGIEIPSATGGELPGIGDIDLLEPRAVALAELNVLVEQQAAELTHELADDGTGVWSYEVVVAPGVFVRCFYLPSSGGTVRVLFGSLFDLDNDDIDRMRGTVRTDMMP